MLRATLPDDAVFAPDRVLLLPSEMPVSDDEAVTWLVAMGKPLSVDPGIALPDWSASR